MVAAKASVWEWSLEERRREHMSSSPGLLDGKPGTGFERKDLGNISRDCGSCSRWAMWGPDLRKESGEE